MKAGGTAHALHPPRRADGFSYVEILVSIVLVGSVVIATLVSLRATIVANEVGDQRSQLLLWMQNGVEAVQRHPYEPCTSGVAGVAAAYDSAVAAVVPPDGMGGGSLTVDGVEFLSIEPVTHVERWGTQCDTGRGVQLVTMRAIAPDASQTITLEVIVDD